MTRTSTMLSGIVLALTAAGIAPALAGPTPPVVIELFTSQGCSSCPPANANLITLSQRPDVLVLSFSVTYWDRLGWKDTFGKPEFTDRQVVYEPALNQFGPYTPQMVVNGRATVVGNRLDAIDALIASTAPLDGPALDLGTAMLTIGTGTAPANGADIWRVTYDPNVVEVPIARGENTGSTLAHTHVVHTLENLGTWTGAMLDLPLGPAAQGLRTAILLQGRNGGPILSATTN
ncbi:hypothetical protein VW29_01020 [Devosia limi DSM 17137]|uniref:DUF1223 domain-containing protein n=1 Tax=Devosia limi DSM 17137 TaxID=1121477 RepID=A0A0F5LWN6_9HYPH|nr:DUF1223 domain-containing protein [Devosia limi]KKB86706.1 hypothetical protein VW29_01020 [Devosia limi DSM 17137]SHE84496.1 hypothetical protein SAMN02745223_01202 [Devosia limi DSM 17137]